MDALADTCFFIDLQRGTNGAAEWLEQNSGYRIVASLVTYAELAAGFPIRAELDNHLIGVPLLSIDASVAWVAGQIARVLKSKGNMIGANDIWIAACAIHFGLPILTRNRTDFARVEGLGAVFYG